MPVLFYYYYYSLSILSFLSPRRQADYNYHNTALLLL
jgi:hypothetical protein